MFGLTKMKQRETLNRMVKYSAAALDATFGALADATRRAVLARLALGEISVSEIAAPFVQGAYRRERGTSREDAGGTKGPRMSFVAVTKHLRVLEGAGLVRTEKDGRVRRCQLSPAPLRDAAEWIRFYQKFWEDQFDALERYIEEVKKEDPSWRPRQPEPPLRDSKSGARSRPRGRAFSKRGRSRNS